MSYTLNSTETLGRKQRAGEGEYLGRNLDFYTVRTLLDISRGASESESQARLNALIQIIGTRAQPIIVNIEPVATETDPADLPGGEGAVSVYTLKFAIEHEGAWEATPSLAQSLVGVAGFTADNVSVTYHSEL